MEKKVLFNCLEAIRKGQPPPAPDSEYLKALCVIGLVAPGWDDSLTSFGHSTLEWLRNSIQTW